MEDVAISLQNLNIGKKCVLFLNNDAHPNTVIGVERGLQFFQIIWSVFRLSISSI